MRRSTRSQRTQEDCATAEGGGNGVAAAGRLLPAKYALAATPLATSRFRGAMRAVAVGVQHVVFASGLRRTSTETETLRRVHVGVAARFALLLPGATPTLRNVRGLLTFTQLIFYRTPTSRGGMNGGRRR